MFILLIKDDNFNFAPCQIQKTLKFKKNIKEEFSLKSIIRNS